MLSPGAYAVYGDGFQFHEVGAAASEGIEAIAEDGVPDAALTLLSGEEAVSASGSFGPPPIAPGASFEFDIDAAPGDRLSFAMMYVQSNDLYYAFAPEGGGPVRCLGPAYQRRCDGPGCALRCGYRAGQPGVGLNQVIHQAALDTGGPEEGAIVRIGDGGSNDGFTYRPNAQIIRVTITPR